MSRQEQKRESVCLRVYMREISERDCVCDVGEISEREPGDERKRRESEGDRKETRKKEKERKKINREKGEADVMEKNRVSVMEGGRREKRDNREGFSKREEWMRGMRERRSERAREREE
jgi:hypothetical protein